MKNQAEAKCEKANVFWYWANKGIGTHQCECPMCRTKMTITVEAKVPGKLANASSRCEDKSCQIIETCVEPMESQYQRMMNDVRQIWTHWKQ